MTDKPVVYVPTSIDVPPIKETIADIPQYDDKGISYKGYSKTPQGNNQYKLKKQDTRFYALGYNGATSTTSTRTNSSTHAFRGRTLTFSWRLSNDIFISLYDTVNTNPKFRLIFPSGTGTIHLNFEDINRNFEGTSIIMDTLTLGGAAYSVGAGEFVYCFISGWDEEF